MVISNVASAKKACQVQDCGSSVLARGYCCKHYYQVKRNGCVGTHRLRRTQRADALIHRLPSCLEREAPVGRHCSVGGCRGQLFDQQLCRLHYIKMRYLGMVGVEAGGEQSEQADPWVMLEEAEA